MAGHSKWKNIQHRKGAQDAKRGKIFTKIAIEITVAARQKGGNPEDNPSLRAALAKAKAANMPKENCQRAIKKGTGDIAGSNYTEKQYEGYGPGGIAIIVECLTDNVNRTVGEVRHAFTRNGGNLGQEGSVSWMFLHKGVLVYDREEVDDQIEIKCPPEQFSALKQELDKVCSDYLFCEITKIPKEPTEVDPSKRDSINKMISILEDNDDVQNVYHNGKLD